MLKIVKLFTFQNSQWFCQNIFFISWHKYWKGVYIHFVPCYSVRFFLWGFDFRRKYDDLSRMKVR